MTFAMGSGFLAAAAFIAAFNGAGQYAMAHNANDRGSRDTVQTVYVMSVPDERYYRIPDRSGYRDRDFDLRDARHAAARLDRSLDYMSDVVLSYGREHYQRLRADLYDMNLSMNELRYAIERREGHWRIREAFRDVEQAARQVEDRLRRVDLRYPIRVAWSHVREAMERTQREIW